MSKAQWVWWGSGLTWPKCCSRPRQHDRGLVVDAPGWQALAVEGALELRVEALGVLAHAV